MGEAVSLLSQVQIQASPGSWRQSLQSIFVLAAFVTAPGDAGELPSWTAMLLNWEEDTTPSHHAVMLEFELFLTLDCVKKGKK